MSSSKLFDLDTQLSFYGAYHSNKINVLIHIICVPLIQWSFQVLAAPIITPFIPKVHYDINEYLAFDLNFPTTITILVLAYYFMLEPTAALLYAPQLTVSNLTATAFARGPGHMTTAAYLHAFSWVAQFIGHGAAEKRAPALLDNLFGALVLAPFFVHLEVLFMAGWRPEMHKRIQNRIGVEIAKIRKAEGDKKRAKNN